jgi:hypothetical protein
MTRWIKNRTWWFTVGLVWRLKHGWRPWMKPDPKTYYSGN